MTTDLREANSAYLAARFLQWGLRPRVRPIQEPEYHELVQRYLDDADFRSLVREIARGLELAVFEASENGLVLGPLPGSAFALRPADFRPNSATVEDRLLDGLVQIAIAATVFPRPADLEDDTLIARPPIGIEDVEELLTAVCERLRDQARESPDPTADDEASGMSEAWRIYVQRASANDSRTGRMSSKTTRGIIQFNLERLRELGCFTRHERAGMVEWQPTWRYQVQAKELTVTPIFQHMLEQIDTDDSTRQPEE